MYKVMLVDDMDISLRQIKRMKLWRGETCFSLAAEAKNGYEALQILKSDKIDLIITDIKMPKIDGIELLKEVTEKKLCSCVVLLSDYADFSYARQGIQYGAFDYLNKPPEYEAMKKLLEKADLFLQEKQREQSLVKGLEEKLKEKIEEVFPAAELEQLIEAVKMKLPDTAQISEHLTEVIVKLLGNDFIKVSSALKKAMSELINRLKLQDDWLDYFIDTESYKKLDYASMNSPMEAVHTFNNSVNEIKNEIEQLEYGNNKDQLENKICQYVLKGVDQQISIEALSKALYMNRKYLSEVFKQRTGELLVEYITRIKMKRAVRLLGNTPMKTFEIALLLGYKDPEYFSRVFKKYKNMSPTQYRNGMDS